MEYLPSSETLSLWLLHYGSITLFFALALGIVALPIPDETLMLISGILMSKGKLNIIPTLFAAYGGAICGITISYIIGTTVGYYFIHRFGGWVGLTDEKLMKAHDWFERYGRWGLFIGYFIPGVRHLTGIFAGTTKIEYSHFALFAYAGAVVWATVFLSIGYFSGEYWLHYMEDYELNFEPILVVILVLLTGYFIYRMNYKQNKV
jgi:membrane protein DedA with SNARE-associated domain